MMGSFSYISSTLTTGIEPMEHNFIHSSYGKMLTNGGFLQSGMSIEGSLGTTRQLRNVTTLIYCRFLGRKEVSIVLPEKMAKQTRGYLDSFINRTRFKVRFFHSQEDLYHQVRTNLTFQPCFAAELSDMTKDQKNINVTIMFPRDVVFDTYSPFFDESIKAPNLKAWNVTMVSGMPELMIYMTNILGFFFKGDRFYDIQLGFIPMKTPDFPALDMFATQLLTDQFPVFFMFTFLMPLYYLVTKLAEERSSKAREGLHMMGLSQTSYFAAWFAFLFIVVSVMSAIIIVVVIKQEVFVDSDPVLIVVMSLLYGMTLFGFSFIVVAFLPNQRTSATAASLIHFTSFYAAMFVSGPSVPNKTKLIASLIPNVAMSLMAQNLFHFELESTGLSMTYAFKTYNNFSFVEGAGMLLFDIVLYGVIGFYLDQVLPKDFGISQPWYFPFLPSTYFGKQFKPLILPNEEVHKADPANFEKITSPQIIKQRENNECLKIRGLSKCYNQETLAVDEVSMTMHPGEIFVLLGHNGAGKTSTISVLTGLLEPTKGQAEINTVTILDNNKEFRDNLGLCPQHNIHFQFLTVREHLTLYATLKEIDPKQIKDRINKTLGQLELYDVENQLASTLSGGQRRKLSVAIALIGNPKILMLDEPTSGMDTATRRKFWEILKQYKKNRIVILTTHYMDEADMLGDQICIMAEGKVQCSGSSLFLKDRFGIGYNVTLAKKSQGSAEIVNEFFKKELPEAKLVQDSNSEIVYQIPVEASSKFTNFFQLLDKNLDKLNASSYGVSKSTLEDVFLKIGHGKDDDRQKQIQDKTKINSGDKSCPDSELMKYSISQSANNNKTFMRQYWALVNKHVIMIRRDLKTFFIDLVFPILLIFIGLYISTIDFLPDNSPPRVLNPRGFPGPRPLFYNSDSFNQSSEIIQPFVEKHFGNKPDLFSELVPLEFDHKDKKFFQNMEIIDNMMWDQRHQLGGMYGTYWIQQVNSSIGFYSIANIVNMTSPTAITSYAAEALEACLRDYSGKDDINLTFIERPLPYSLQLKGYINTAMGTVTAVLFAISFMMMSDAVIQNIIKERTSNVKHHMILSGCNVYAYWAAQYTKDLIMHGIPSLFSLIIVHKYEIDVPDCETHFLFFCLANPLFLYSISFLFDTDSKGSILVRMFYFTMGAIMPLTIQILQVANEKTQLASAYLLNCGFQLLPIFSLDYGYLSIINREVVSRISGRKDYMKVQPLDWEIAGFTQFCLLLTVFIYAFLLYAIESGLLAMLWSKLSQYQIVSWIIFVVCIPYDLFMLVFSKASGKEAMIVDDLEEITIDEDVEAETKRVFSLPPEQAVVHISNLSKTYDYTTIAVNNLNFAIDHGMCFGLLGVTGAGKTSTFKCITGEEQPDPHSQLFVAGHNVLSKQGFEKVKSMIGYCPQFDTLFENLTVYEHFDFFADMKGIDTEIKGALIDYQLRNMDLLMYRNVYANNLSGGNKRKLSCAIAMLGNPELIILDEPSTGVDPQAKRFMWDIISNIPKYHERSCVILTTHSMEEAEALCDKMGIMANGKFKCFGNAQNLKNKLGTAYEIEFKLEPNITEQLVKDTITDLGYFTTHVNRQQSKNLFDSMECEFLNDEIYPHGIGANFDYQFDKQSKVLLTDLVRWTLLQKQAFKLINKLKDLHSSVTIIEQYQNSYKLKVSRDNYSIGFLFGLLESVKDQFHIVNYSVSQTSIEQIFNNLAKEDQLRKQRARLRAITGQNTQYHKQD